MKKLCSLLALLMLLALVLPAYAASPTYALSIRGKNMLLLQNGSVLRSYQLRSPDLTISSSESGKMSIYFFPEQSSDPSGVSLPTTALTITGSMDELYLADSLDSSYTISVGGNLGAVVIYGSPRVQLLGNSEIIKLLKYSTNSHVSLQSGVSIAQTYTLTPPPTFTSSSESLSYTQAPNVPYFDGATRSQIQPLLDWELNPSTEFARSISFDEKACQLTVIAAYPGEFLVDAIRGMRLVARQPDRTLLEGKWDFYVGSANTTESGSYVYRFTPSNNSFASIDIKIRFTATQDRVASARSDADVSVVEIAPAAASQVEVISIPSKTTTALPIGASSILKGYQRTIRVEIPDSAQSGSVLQFRCNGQVAAEFTLSEADAGQAHVFSFITPTSDSVETILMAR